MAYRLKKVEVDRINEPSGGSPDPNDVHATLRGNLAAEDRAGLNAIPQPPHRRSRRKRDYLLAMIVGNLVLLVAAVFAPVFGLAGLVIFDVGVTWIMWFVVDDY